MQEFERRIKNTIVSYDRGKQPENPRPRLL